MMNESKSNSFENPLVREESKSVLEEPIREPYERVPKCDLYVLAKPLSCDDCLNLDNEG